MTAMLELGAFFGSLMAGYLADKYSRRSSIAIGLGWFGLGSLVQTGSMRYETLVLGRTLGGIGIGLLSSTAPMYVAEVSRVGYYLRLVDRIV
jgi:MFS family permease